MRFPPRRLQRLQLLGALALAGSLADGQANQDPAIDVRITNISAVTALGRSGTFPNGVNGISLQTTVCNEGTAEIPWIQPMSPDHPMIAFLVTSVRDDRIVQISDRSMVKHGFFAANTNGCNTDCILPSGFNALGIGCTDTYGTINNGDHFYLGPPDEIDPWLGTWDPFCSLFDRGVPDVGAPQNCDGVRSLTRTQTNALGPVGHRIRVTDRDLLDGARLTVQAQYVVRGMPEAARDDSISFRPFSADWTGNNWFLSATGQLQRGSILQRWADASVTSNTNGGDDGRVDVAVKVTGPVEGFYHYEYALHNRDNARGIGGLRIPLCPGARVRNAGFRDVDQEAGNDWTASVNASEVIFATPVAPLEWNTIFNFWFDSDAAPSKDLVTLEQFTPGAGLPEFVVETKVPTGLFNVHLGPGCALGTPPTLYAIGSPARAEIGNATFGVASSGNEPFQPNVLHLSTDAGSRVLRNCTLWTGALQGKLVSKVLTDANGVATHPGPIPSNFALEGTEFRMQAVGRRPGLGVLLGNFELSDGLLVRVGTLIPACP